MVMLRQCVSARVLRYTRAVFRNPVLSMISRNNVLYARVRFWIEHPRVLESRARLCIPVETVSQMA